MSRQEIHNTFVSRFSFPRLEPVAPVSAEDLSVIESELRVTFPKAYQEFLTQYGPIFTPDILTLVTGGESEQAPPGASWDIHQFLPPNEIVETYRLYVSGGMEDWLTPIAQDSMGNLFGFRREVIEPRPEDSAIFFFDHDFCTLEQEAPSFDAWPDSFLKMKLP